MPELNDDVLDTSADDDLDAILDEQDGDTDPDAEKDRADDTEDADEDGEAEAKDSDEEDKDEAKDKDDQKGKPGLGSRLDRRIGKLTREKNDARREADYWKSVAEQSRTQPRQPQRQEERGDDASPTPEDIEARATQIAESAIARREFLARRDKLTEKLETGGATEALKRLSNDALTAFEVEAVEALADAKFPVEVAKAIAGNELLFTQFAKCRTGVQRATLIARLDGRIEARREQRKGADVKPNRQVRGSARSVEKHPDDMSQSEYEAYRKKQGWA